MASFLDNANSALAEAKDSVTATADSVGASLTDAQKTVTQTATTSLTDAQKTVADSTETVKSEAAAAPEKVSDVSTKVGSWSLSHPFTYLFVPKTKIHIVIFRQEMQWTVLCQEV